MNRGNRKSTEEQREGEGLQISKPCALSRLAEESAASSPTASSPMGTLKLPAPVSVGNFRAGYEIVF